MVLGWDEELGLGVVYVGWRWVPFSRGLIIVSGSECRPGLGLRRGCRAGSCPTVSSGCMSGCVSRRNSQTQKMLTHSKIEQTRLGRRYGNLAKSPWGEKIEGRPSAGLARSPPMAVYVNMFLIPVAEVELFEEHHTRPDDRPQGPKERHHGICLRCVHISGDPKWELGLSHARSLHPRPAHRPWSG